MRFNFGEAEVQHLCLASSVGLFDEKDVRGLDVAMDDSLGVSGGQGIGDLHAEGENIVRRHGPAENALFESLAFEEFHDEIGVAVLLSDIEDGADVGMIECRGGAGLLEEALPHSGHLIVFLQQLDGDLSLQSPVPCPEDQAHGSATQRAQDFIGSELLADLRNHPLIAFPCSTTIYSRKYPARVTIITRYFHSSMFYLRPVLQSITQWCIARIGRLIPLFDAPIVA